MAVVSDPPRPPLEVMPSLNPALAAVALMALEKEPTNRFQSARAMRQAIEVAGVHAAENEEVAELMNELWPEGDEERVALHTLSSGMSEESSSPALRSVVSGTYPSMVSPNVDQRTKVIEPPPGLLLPPPSFDTAELPAFDQPATSRKWRVMLAVIAVALLAGLGGVAGCVRAQHGAQRGEHVALPPVGGVQEAKRHVDAVVSVVSPSPSPDGRGERGLDSVRGEHFLNDLEQLVDAPEYQPGTLLTAERVAQYLKKTPVLV